MTREQILAMQPGRELDALVAEKVMGLTNFYWLSGERFYGPEYQHNRLSDYSTDISAAWEVVDKIGSVKVLGPTIQGEWYSSVLGNRKVGVWAKTAPEAICKAALIACMEVE